MRTLNIFTSYNLKQFKSSKILYFFICISVTIATCMALSVPVVINTMTTASEKSQKRINGADIKIEMNYKSQNVCDKLDSLVDSGVIKNYTYKQAYNASIRHQKNDYYIDLVTEDNLADNEATVSSTTAEKLNLHLKDKISVLGENYTIKSIDDLNFGVSSQASQLGYVKLNSKNISIDTKPYAHLYLINAKSDSSSKIKSLKAQLKKDFKKDFNSSCIISSTEDVAKENAEKINSTVLIINMLNTIVFLFTLFAIISCLNMILSLRNKDIAAMKLSNIPSKNIKNAFLLEFFSTTTLGIILGAILSNKISFLMLKYNGITSKNTFSINSALTIFVGCILFEIIYILYGFTLAKKIKHLKPLAVIKGDEPATFKRRHGFSMILITIISMFVYSIYVGTITAFISSVIIFIVLLLLFVVSILLIYILSSIPLSWKCGNYTFKKIKSRKCSNALVVVSLVFMSSFILFGFRLPQGLTDSYSKGLNDTLPYNHIAFVSAKKDFNPSKKITYSKFDVNFDCTTIDQSNNSLVPVIFAKTSKDNYGLKCKIKSGVNLFEGSGVLISDVFAKDHNLNLRDNLTISYNDISASFKIKGIYVSKNINPTIILSDNTSNVLTDAKDSFSKEMYLMNCDSATITAEAKSLKGAMFLNISDLNDALLSLLDGYVKMLRLLSIICIIVAIIFGLNVCQLFSIKDGKEYAIIRGLGLTKGFLTCSNALELIQIDFISSVLSIAFYYTVSTLLSTNLFKETFVFSVFDGFLIILLNTLIAFIIFSKRQIHIQKKSNDFTLLKDYD